MDNDRERAEVALGYIQELYEAERVTREQVLPPDERKELRLVRSLPVLNELGKWMHAEGKTVLPKSQMGKAIAYSLSRWDALSAYLYDGHLEIDNNLVENLIRPVALGGRTICLLAPTKPPGAQQWSTRCWPVARSIK